MPQTVNQEYGWINVPVVSTQAGKCPVFNPRNRQQVHCNQILFQINSTVFQVDLAIRIVIQSSFFYFLRVHTKFVLVHGDKPNFKFLLNLTPKKATQYCVLEDVKLLYIFRYTCSIEGAFLQGFLVIVKRLVHNYQKTLKTYFLNTSNRGSRS